MKKIRYVYVKGDVTEVEVSDELWSVIRQMERSACNSDRRESRRHCSLEEWEESHGSIADLVFDVENEVVRREEQSALYRAIEHLRPDEQELIRAIYLSEEMTVSEYAGFHGISIATLQKRTERIRKKLQKYLSE